MKRAAYLEHVKWLRSRFAATVREAPCTPRRQRKSKYQLLTIDQWQEKLVRQNGRCYWCCKKVGAALETDHIIPLSRNGSDHADNLTLSCKSCNSRKSSSHPLDFTLSLLS